MTRRRTKEQQREYDLCKIEILERARALVSGTTFICRSLRMAQEGLIRAIPGTSRTWSAKEHLRSDLILRCAEELRLHVMKGIKPYAYYTSWLADQSEDFASLLLREKERRQAATEGRVAWINHMIEQLRTPVK